MMLCPARGRRKSFPAHGCGSAWRVQYFTPPAKAVRGKADSYAERCGCAGGILFPTDWLRVVEKVIRGGCGSSWLSDAVSCDQSSTLYEGDTLSYARRGAGETNLACDVIRSFSCFRSCEYVHVPVLRDPCFSPCCEGARRTPVHSGKNEKPVCLCACG